MATGDRIPATMKTLQVDVHAGERAPQRGFPGATQPGLLLQRWRRKRGMKSEKKEICVICKMLMIQFKKRAGAAAPVA